MNRRLTNRRAAERPHALATACLLLLISAASPATAAAQEVDFGTLDEFRPPLVRLAAAVAKVLQSRGEEAITVGAFTGPPALGAAAGPGLRQMLVDELGRLGVRVPRLGTALGLTAEYRYLSETNQSEQVRIEVKLTDRSGQIVTDLGTDVAARLRKEDANVETDDGKIDIPVFPSPNALSALLGLTRDFEPLGRDDFGPRPNVIDAPATAVVVRGTQLRASRTSPYGLEVLVGGQARPVTIEEGVPFVDLAKGESFRLRVVNDAPFEIASIFTLDGVNSFAFSKVRTDGRPKYSRWVVPPRKSFDLAGWHTDNTQVREFKVTDFSDSAAALAGSESNLGAITVIVRATWPEGTQPPPGEPISVGAALPDAGIGFGDDAEQRVREDAARREFGEVRAVLTVRYEKPAAAAN